MNVIDDDYSNTHTEINALFHSCCSFDDLCCWASEEGHNLDS